MGGRNKAMVALSVWCGSYIVFLGSGAGFPPDKTISVYEAFGVARSAAR